MQIIQLIEADTAYAYFIKKAAHYHGRAMKSGMRVHYNMSKLYLDYANQRARGLITRMQLTQGRK